MHTTTKDSGYIVHEGQGGFLNPPTHPEHTLSVWVGKRSNPNACLSLSCAVESEWLSDATRARAKELLDAWQAPAIESQEVQEWILQVLGYFRNCYKGDEGPECWHASKLRISKDADPVASADLHAGVHLIRHYYPTFQPTREQFAQAYWGKKS